MTDRAPVAPPNQPGSDRPPGGKPGENPADRLVEQCQETTLAGEQCSRKSLPGSDYCRQHQPEGDIDAPEQPKSLTGAHRAAAIARGDSVGPPIVESDQTPEEAIAEADAAVAAAMFTANPTIDDFVDNGRVFAAINAFPTTVDGLDECRLFLLRAPGTQTLYATWYVTTQHGIEVAGEIQEVTDQRKGGRLRYFTTADGVEHTYHKTPNCGCSNRLRTWRPWSNSVQVVQVAMR